MPSTSPTTSAMAPKADKGKGVKSAEAQRLAALRKERVIFSPQLGVKELREYFYLFWATETRAHEGTPGRCFGTGSKRVPILRAVLLLQALPALLEVLL